MSPKETTIAAAAVAAVAMSGCGESQAQAEAEPGPAPHAAGPGAPAEGSFPAGPYADNDPKLAKRLVDAGALLIDVRSPDEFASGHVDGAINIVHTQIRSESQRIRELQGGDLERPIVVYCRSGRRSGMAKDDLLAAGFTRVSNLGGVDDWPG
ncbi:rhodanese-like domain-containing protein [Pseudenhygromyxa sp. WMMC2535]|uniref:rhodanese-like domain-containing protein n=1 Tax=Pseudenhygromyxa sp. WMMC2535 TaxID=2712867 RepID=UPI001557830E|nr:rhodanese-like domain-containing protein [Pseudenhygromyxa sp. WMMC2535]NVB38131.1 rhodanese-like domain-containing protein [Pseudenhygromyxa sp. WMMC2535]